MRDVFGIIIIFIQNLPIAQEDIKHDNKSEKFLRLTLEKLDIKIIALG